MTTILFRWDERIDVLMNRFIEMLSTSFFDLLGDVVRELTATGILAVGKKIVASLRAWREERPVILRCAEIPSHVRGRGGSRVRCAHAELCSAAIRGSFRRWFPCGEREEPRTHPLFSYDR